MLAMQDDKGKEFAPQIVRKLIPTTAPANTSENTSAYAMDQAVSQWQMSAASAAGVAQHLEVAGCTFGIATMEDNGTGYLGAVGGTAFSPAPTGQRNEFYVDVVKGNARFAGGAMSETAFDTFMNEAGRDKRRLKAAHAAQAT